MLAQVSLRFRRLFVVANIYVHSGSFLGLYGGAQEKGQRRHIRILNCLYGCRQSRVRSLYSSLVNSS